MPDSVTLTKQDLTTIIDSIFDEVLHKRHSEFVSQVSKAVPSVSRESILMSVIWKVLAVTCSIIAFLATTTYYRIENTIADHSKRITDDEKAITALDLKWNTIEKSLASLVILHQKN